MSGRLSRWPSSAGSGSGVAPRRRQRLVDESAQAGGRQLLPGGIHGREVRRRRHALEVVRAHLELPTLEAAAETDLGPRNELRREPFLVEPDRRYGAGLVADARAHDREPPARATDADVLDDSADRDLVLGKQIDDAPLGGNGLVTPRRVDKQVVDGCEAELGEPLPDPWPDTAQRLKRPLEDLGPAGDGRAGPFRRPVHDGEARGQAGHGG